jgi:hypothetical protein
MKSIWATSSAAVFFLAETQAYLQGEVVQGSWDGFRTWLTGESKSTISKSSRDGAGTENKSIAEVSDDDDDDIWLKTAKDEAPDAAQTTSKLIHDPQTLATAHRVYLNHLTASLLLTQPTFTEPLYSLLQSIDHLVALIHRVHTIWASLDLEADEGVVDAFSDFAKEEVDVRVQLGVVGTTVKEKIWKVVGSLKDLDAQGDAIEQDDEHEESDRSGWGADEEWHYSPKMVGRVDRLLMKLDFGGWFNDYERLSNKAIDMPSDGDDDDDE